MTVDELNSMPKCHFIVMKTACHPMRTRLKLFLQWGIRFEEQYEIAEHSAREVKYADRHELAEAVQMVYPPKHVPVEFREECLDNKPPKRVRNKSPKIR